MKNHFNFIDIVAFYILASGGAQSEAPFWFRVLFTTALFCGYYAVGRIMVRWFKTEFLITSEKGDN